jgi:muramoyltetrapeptide carboxypeptidase
MSRSRSPRRIHLIAHANPLEPEVKQFGFVDADEYVAFAEQHLPKPLRLTCNLRLLKAEEFAWAGGRQDDAARIRDLQRALDDPQTLAIVATNGGAYFTRILPHLDFSTLAKRSTPLWALGFSEMTPFVGAVASYRGGRGLYWLCPNWLGWRIRPEEAARAALGEFWQILPEVFAGKHPAEARHVPLGPLEGEIVQGRVRAGRVRLVGGCLAVLAAAITGPLEKRLRPRNKWLILEDIKESPYRIDRHLASLKLAGWFDCAAGLIVGDFRMIHQDTQPAVLELLKYHLPRDRKLPVITTRSFGHVWPQMPVLLNQPLALETRGRAVTIRGSIGGA